MSIYIKEQNRKNEIRPIPITLYKKKIKPKLIKNLHLKLKTVKLLDESISNIQHNWELIKLKHFCLTKETFNSVKNRNAKNGK